MSTATDYAEIADCDLVIEAVVERMDVKKSVFETLDGVMKPGAVLATNTSTLNVDEIAAVTKRPGDVLGLHFFSPANIMKLLEIVRGAQTSDEVLATALALAKRLRKVPVVAGVCDGFIANRMIDEYINQAMFLVEEGALQPRSTKRLEKWGMAMGPFRMSDVVGNDIPWHARQERRKTNPNRIMPRIPDASAKRAGLARRLGWVGMITQPGRANRSRTQSCKA